MALKTITYFGASSLTKMIINPSTITSTITSVALVANMLSGAAATLLSPDVTVERFISWKNRYNVSYPTPTEELVRFNIWADTNDYVTLRNVQHSSWVADTNRFADQTADEFNSWANGMFPLGAKYADRDMHVSTNTHLPSSIDWRTNNVVNPVKNQAQCGSCWAFSAIGSLESQYALKNKKLISFSEQDLVDCVQNVDGCCYGCGGGLMDAAFTYMVQSQNGNDDLESVYKYTGMDGTCQFKNDGPGYGGIIGHKDIVAGSDADLKDALVHVGPISIGVDANYDWQVYSGGVYTPGEDGCSSDPSQMDHGVVLVGYGHDSFNGVKKNYWIIRNSWDKTWGIDGYMYLDSDVDNACGISNSASYPVLADVTTGGNMKMEA